MIAAKHLEITEILRKRIESGFYAGKIPSVALLSKEFNVNPITLRKSLKSLESEKLIEKKTRIGTFVRRKGRIAFIFAKQRSFTNNMLYMRLMDGIKSELEQKHNFTLSVYSGADLESSGFAQKLKNQVDGCIVHSDYSRKYEKILSDVPHLFVMGYRAEIKDKIYIAYDNSIIGKLAADYLLAQKSENLIYFGRLLTDLDRERFAIFKDAAELAGINPTVIDCDIDRDKNADIFELARTKLADNIIEHKSLRTGVYLSADVFSPLTYQALYSRSIMPVRDFNIVSVNNNPYYLNMVHPAPPSIDIKMFDLGRSAVENLFRIMNKERISLKEINLIPELVLHDE